MLRAREGDVEHGIPIVPKMGRITFEGAATDLLNDYKTNKKRSYAHAERRITLHLKPAFKGRRLISIRSADIRAYIAERQQTTEMVKRAHTVTRPDGTTRKVREFRRAITGVSNAAINRELALLKRMFSLAVKDGKLHAKPYVPMLQEDNARKGFFERDQFEAVRSHLPAPLRSVVTFAYLTGWRMHSEILPLEWRHVDWTGRVVRLDPGTTKNREGRSFPFTAALEAVLKEQLAEQQRVQSRSHPARLSSNGCEEPRARGRPAFSGDGDGRSQDRGNPQAVRDR